VVVVDVNTAAGELSMIVKVAVVFNLESKLSSYHFLKLASKHCSSPPPDNKQGVSSSGKTSASHSKNLKILFNHSIPHAGMVQHCNQI